MPVAIANLRRKHEQNDARIRWYRCQPGSSVSGRHPAAFPIGWPDIYHHSDDVPVISGNVPVIPAKAGIHFLTVIPAIYPSFRRQPESIFLPSFRRFTRHSGESRNLAPPPDSAFRRSNGFAPQPPKKSAIFSDATHLQSIQKSCTLAPASPATRPRGVTFPQKPTRAAQVHGDRNPPDSVSSPKAKASGEKSGNHKNRVQDNTAKPSVLQPSSDPARTPLYSTGVCQATPRAFPPLYAGPAMGRGMEN